MPDAMPDAAPAEESERPAPLPPSDLGTKEYWDHVYANELRNHAADASDIGTVWFDDSRAEAKMVALLQRLAAAPDGPAPRAASLLDLGCGNASLLLALRDAGWTGRARGVDYSPQSIALARRVVAAASPPVELAEWDLVAGPLETVLADAASGRGWDVVLDKGTFDAVSLSDVDEACETYRRRLARIVAPAGLFVVTSCNWTEPELVEWFTGRRAAHDGKADFAVVDRVQYPTLSFGGAKGQTISTVCFRKL